MNVAFHRILTKCFFGICALLVATLSFAQQPDTAKLVQTAVSGDGQARYAAIDDLGELHVDSVAAVVPVLQKLLNDGDEQVQWRSARSLGDYGAEAKAAAPALQALLASKVPAVQYHAVVALGRIGDKSDATIDALVAAATGDEARVARAAIAAIRQLKPGPEKVVKALKQALTSDDQVVVAYALEAIVHQGADAVPFLNEALKQPETVYLACAAIDQIGPEAAGTVPALTEVLGNAKHSHLMIQALLALAHIGPEAQSAVPQIVTLLEHSTDSTVPVAAAYALGSIAATDADEPLRQAMAKPNPLLQMVAAWSLAKIHPEDAQLKQQAIEKLQAGLKSDDPAVQAAAKKGLQLLEPPAKEFHPE